MGPARVRKRFSLKSSPITARQRRCNQVRPVAINHDSEPEEIVTPKRRLKSKKMRPLVLKDDEEEALALSLPQANRQTSPISISSDGFSDREMQEAMYASLDPRDAIGQGLQDPDECYNLGSSPLSAIPILDGSTDNKDDTMSVCSDQSPGGIALLPPPGLQLPPPVHKEMESIMAHLDFQMFLLGTTTPDVVPPPSIGLYIRSSTHLQIIKRRLAPLGRHILKHIETLPEEKRVARELDLCRYLSEFWPLPLHEHTHLDIQAMYRVHFYKENMKQKQKTEAAKNAREAREARLALGNRLADINITSPGNLF